MFKLLVSSTPVTSKQYSMHTSNGVKRYLSLSMLHDSRIVTLRCYKGHDSIQYTMSLYAVCM